MVPALVATMPAYDAASCLAALWASVELYDRLTSDTAGLERNVAARDAVRSRELGRVTTVRSTTLDPAPPPAAYLAVSGGIFRDCSVHDLDAVRWVTGQEVVEVYATGAVDQLTAGASGFLLKDAEPEALLDATPRTLRT